MNNLINELRYSEYKERVKSLKYLSKPLFVEDKRRKKQIHVVYILNHVGVCGGTKVILEHANGLIDLGLKVTLLSHFPKPNWFVIKADYIQAPFQIELSKYIPICDVIIATYWEHIGSCVESGIAPVIYFEQGDFHLFEWETIEEEKRNIIYSQIQLPHEILAVSSQISQLIKVNFNRDSLVVHNALNEEIFYNSIKSGSEINMLVVGREETEFKGINDLKKVYNVLLEKGFNIKFSWVTQTTPQNPLGEVYINPTQEKLGELYREATIYVCGSYYESFPLPPLEAMASGTPVVTTRNLGINEYGIDEYNCLMAEPGDINSISEKIIRILSDKDLYDNLITNGLTTANKFNWSIILNELKNFYENIATKKTFSQDKLDDEWEFLFNVKDIVNKSDKDRLKFLLNNAKSDSILMPVQLEIIPDIPTCYWKELIVRKTPIGLCGPLKLPIIVKGEFQELDIKYKDIIYLYKDNRYSEALNKFINELRYYEVGTEEHSILIKWIALCLFELNQDNDLQELLEASIKKYPYYTDLYFIYGLLLFNNGFNDRALQILHQIEVVQDAFYHTDFIGNIKEISRNAYGII
ncbi:glycosyltransferase involved in cell wall biosynthesis [Bacillus tianshenii]|uniref:Glycosyltransferase involved in cell wall biosynthesis n=1 Tax=Sutcliffiella tianshenii TaxID=1463404 RepID=A0ABS2NUM2_9BACI|nr:glycosyltransferase family 4 protein [Bacillus tianshenii]MBM7618361.1 glycosyltransferase involved in cell wall biosynthesis [Bacillus tianshenii]